MLRVFGQAKPRPMVFAGQCEEGTALYRESLIQAGYA
jgi:hypothetical protein